MPPPALDLEVPAKRLRDPAFTQTRNNLSSLFDPPVHLDGARVELELLQHAVVGVAQEGESSGGAAHLRQLVPQQRVLVVEPLQRLALPAAEQEIVHLKLPQV